RRDRRQPARARGRRGRGGRGRPAGRRARRRASFRGVTPRDVVNSYFAALARHDTRAAAELLDPEVVWEVTSVGVLRGRDEVAGFFDGLFKAVPDIEIRAERTIRERDTVVVQWRMQGNFTGGPLFNGIQANGNEVRMRGADVFEVRDDLVVSNTGYQDGL